MQCRLEITIQGILKVTTMNERIMTNNNFQSFSAGFKNNLKDVNVMFMQSDGGLTAMNS
jgi:N-methylhydantoinase A/oxoprolinase/acetone carboxylase beta subunit